MPVLQRRVLDIGVQEDAGVVQQNIQPAMVLAQMSHDVAPIALTAGVMPDKGRRRTDLGGQGLTLRDIQVADQHVGALRRQQASAGPPDALCTSGDQCNLAVYTAIRVVVVVRHDVVSRAKACCCWSTNRAAAAPARRPENTQSARDKPLI